MLFRSPRTITSYEVYFSLYQQLAGKNEEQDENAENALDKLSQLFSPDFFDLIIVDECHRGSAKKESNWRKILEYFAPYRKKREELENNMDYVEKILKKGAEKARDIASKKVSEVRKTVGLMGRNY